MSEKQHARAAHRATAPVPDAEAAGPSHLEVLGLGSGRRVDGKRLAAIARGGGLRRGMQRGSAPRGD